MPRTTFVVGLVALTMMCLVPPWKGEEYDRVGHAAASVIELEGAPDMAPLNPGETKSTEEEEIKVISYNIWNGFDWGKDTDRHQLFTDWVKEQEPDVLALQELCGYTPEQLEREARQWGHPYAVLLKEDGYPVGLTSNEPIELKAKVLDDMWHGMLHVSTYDIDIFVVHLSPSDLTTRMREAEIITRRIQKLGHENFLILGDFNAHSPFDAHRDKAEERLIARYRDLNAEDNQYDNLRHGDIDYSVLSRFLGLPAIDLCLDNMPANKRYSFPSPVKVGVNLEDLAQMEAVRRRIDFILAGSVLAEKSMDANIVHDEQTNRISDHYPVMATLAIR